MRFAFSLRFAAFCLSVAVLHLKPLPAEASTMIAMSLPELVNVSDTIVRGTVVSRQSQWKNGKIMTHCTLVVDEVIRGVNKNMKTMTVVLQGGEIGNVGLKVVGEPECGQAGSRVIIMTTRHESTDTYRPSAMTQGWFSLKTDTLGRELVHPATAGLRLVAPTQNGALLDTHGTMLQPEPVPVFVDRLRYWSNQPSPPKATSGVRSDKISSSSSRLRKSARPRGTTRGTKSHLNSSNH